MSDTTPRDKLAEDIGWLLLQRPHPEMPSLNETEAAVTGACVAGAMAGLGWRPPARVVTTVEELDALVAHTVVRYCTRYGWGTAEKVACDRWWPAGVVVYLTNTQVLRHGPATVLYEPEEGE